MISWLARELRLSLPVMAGWGALICLLMFLLAISGALATDKPFMASTIVGFFVCLIVWFRFRK